MLELFPTKSTTTIYCILSPVQFYDPGDINAFSSTSYLVHRINKYLPPSPSANMTATPNITTNVQFQPSFPIAIVEATPVLLAGFALSLVGEAVAEGVPVGVREAVVFICSRGTMTASRTCMRPLFVLRSVNNHPPHPYTRTRLTARLHQRPSRC